MLAKCLFRVIRTTQSSSKWENLGKGARFERITKQPKQNFTPSSKPDTSSTSQKSPKQPKKHPSKVELPEELKKAGISSKGFDAEMLKLYNSMKSQGADQYAKEQVDKILSFEEKSSFQDFPGENLKKPRNQVNYKSLFPGKQKSEPIYKEEELPEAVQNKFQKTLKQHQESEKIFRNKDLEKQKRQEFKDLVEKDSEKTRDKVIDKEFGWMDKIKVREPRSKAFQEVLDSWEPSQRDYFDKKTEKEDRLLNKELRKLERIKQRRKIREDYKNFKISLEPNKNDDIHLLRSKRYILSELEDILADSKQCKTHSAVALGILQGAFLTIHDIILTKSLSVIHVFFTVSFIEGKERPFEQVKQQHEEIRRKLVHSTPYIKAKLTEKAGLKYAPDLRFYPYDPAGSPKQVLAGLENMNSFYSELPEKDPREAAIVESPKLPGKYMKRKYYQEVGNPKKKSRKPKK